MPENQAELQERLMKLREERARINEEIEEVTKLIAASQKTGLKRRAMPHWRGDGPMESRKNAPEP